MVRSCYVCSRKQTKNKNFFLHKFPNNPEICLKWKQFCGLREIDDVRSLHICSFHFCPEDFRHHALTIQARNYLLNPGAVPSIRKPQILKNTESSVKENLKANDNEIVKETELEMLISSESEWILANEYVESQINLEVVYLSDKIEQTDIVEPQENNLSSVNVDNISQLQSEIQNNVDENMELEIEIQNNANMELETDSNLCPHSNVEIETAEVINSLQDDLTPKCAESCDISEMTSDEQTPKKTRRITKFIEDNGMKQKERIKKLEKMNRNLKKRIETLKNMISHLKKN